MFIIANYLLAVGLSVGAECIVISLGGSVLVPGNKDVEYLRALSSLLKRLSRERKLYVVTGGGKTARYYIETGRAAGLSERYLDELGIGVTRINAHMLIGLLGRYANAFPPMSETDAALMGKRCRIVVMGGTTPGHTTDFVAAKLATIVDAKRLVNATSVPGIFTSDPTRNKDARRLERIGYAELLSICRGGHRRAGPSIVMDPKAARIVAKSKIPLAVLDGRDVRALSSAITGRKFDGTLVAER